MTPTWCAAWTARATLSANLFAAGGIETVTGPVEGFAEAGTAVACLCSSDKLYAEEAAVAAKSLRAAGAEEVWLAGKVETERVDGYLYLGCDALAVLTRVLETLGVAA